MCVSFLFIVYSLSFYFSYSFVCLYHTLTFSYPSEYFSRVILLVQSFLSFLVVQSIEQQSEFVFPLVYLSRSLTRSFLTLSRIPHAHTTHTNSHSYLHTHTYTHLTHLHSALCSCDSGYALYPLLLCIMYMHRKYIYHINIFYLQKYIFTEYQCSFFSHSCANFF